MADYYLGIMSGTSLDGVDLALVDFAQYPPKITACECFSMPEPLRQAITTVVKQGFGNLQTLGELDHQLGLLYAQCVNDFLHKQQISSAQITAIGCHGQTIWHAPQGNFPFTTQIGDMHLLTAKTGIPTVGDFRRKDMAYGGQGAPLVPAFHQACFAHSDRVIGVLNIGGISNISLLCPNQETIGYDIGAGNTLMDLWIEKHLDVRYDKNGSWARTGNIVPELLVSLLDEPYFAQTPPKSTGRELFNLTWLEKKLTKHTACSAQDIQATLVEFTAQSIANDLAKIRLTQTLPCELLVCGGGAHNVFLMERLAYLCHGWQVRTTNDYGLNVDFVEAAAFAWLAYQRIHNMPSNLPCVTGARQAVSLGVIFTKE